MARPTAMAAHFRNRTIASGGCGTSFSTRSIGGGVSCCAEARIRVEGAVMRSWSVTARGLAAVEVQGRNWIVALGRGLDELGRADELLRLACEVLPNGTVIARDITSGTGYVVQAVETVEPAEPIDGLEVQENGPADVGGHDDGTSEAPLP